MRNALVLVSLTILIAVESIAQSSSVKIFGHRGCRGLYPENTLEGFAHAIDLGVDGIEWDVIVSQDGQLVISHEPYLDASYCLGADGKEISAADGKKINFYELSAEEIRRFDCGSKPYPKYPEQKKMATYKPLVQEAFNRLNLSNTTILFEIKSEQPDYGEFQPMPEEYAQIIANEVAYFAHKQNIIFMCFDPQLLEALHKLLPDYRYVYLTYKPFTSVKKFLEDISFTPYALGMYHPTVRKKDVKYLHERDVKLFAWTVNKVNQADKLKRYGVDGIITDYPDRITR
jgi:glycerophosphoryl diester phosphodiesterase